MKLLYSKLTLLVLLSVIFLSGHLNASSVEAYASVSEPAHSVYVEVIGEDLRYKIPLCNPNSSHRKWFKAEVTSRKVTNKFDGRWSEFRTTPGICKEVKEYYSSPHAPSYKAVVKFKLNGKVVRKVELNICHGCSRSWGGW